MEFFFAYSMGLFFGIHIGKTMYPNHIYLLNNYNKVNIDYYKNYQMDYRFNK